MKPLKKLVFLGALFSLQVRAAQVLDRVAAVVGDEPILQSDVSNFKKALETSPALAGIYRVQKNATTFDDILKLVIEERLIHYSVKEMGVTVSDTEVDTQINNIAKQNNITRAQLEDSLRRENISTDLYRRNIKTQLERQNIFERELRKGGGVSEREVRDLYEKTAPFEYKLHVIALKKSPGTRKKLEDLASNLRSGSATKEEVAKTTGEDLGWIAAESLDESLAKALKTSDEKGVVGPVDSGAMTQLLLVNGTRKGSEESFQKAKAELSMMAQGQDYERRFTAWLERRKNELQIVVNKP
jgi:peptidyl-prolyl cis-trans isomerase SurA